MLPENNPQLKSFIEVSPTCDFPIQNLPYGIFCPKNQSNLRVGVAIGDYVLDLAKLEERGYFNTVQALKNKRIFNQPALNSFIDLGRANWREVRAIISRLLRDDEPTLRDNHSLREEVLFLQTQVHLYLPLQIQGYTDFYSSIEHASNVGTMFRGKDNALPANWLHLPIGYDGRASSIVVSGTPFRRPMGQILPQGAEVPVYSESLQLDTEVEVAFIMGPGNRFGEPISVHDAPQHVFGMALLSDWSARDIQRWEYVPLGPFLAKNFCTTLSPWIVTLDALEPFRTSGREQNPKPLSYLQSSRDWAYNIELEFLLQSQKMLEPQRIAAMNYQGIYWDFCQQLAHHTMGGCQMQVGDIFASGTISGPSLDSAGSLLEITWAGAHPIQLHSGEQRTFLQDGDTVMMRGGCQGQGYRVGFGELTGQVLPSLKQSNEVN